VINRKINGKTERQNYNYEHKIHFEILISRVYLHFFEEAMLLTKQQQLS